MITDSLIVKVSAESVLSVLQAIYSDYCACTKQPNSDLILTNETPVSDIGKIDDGFIFVFFFHNYGVPIPRADLWQSIVTIGDFCRHIANTIQLPIIEPAVFFDKQCDSAGLFLAIKKQLVNRGECESEIGPSTKLAPFIKRNHDFFAMLRWLHPESMPSPSRWHLLSGIGCLLYVTYLIGFAIVLFMGQMQPITELALKCLTFISPIIFLMFLSISERIDRNRLVYVEYGGLTDFRSLVTRILSIPRSSIA